MVYPIIKIDFHEFANYNWNAIILGTIVSAIVGYLCIKYFLKFVGKYSLAFFGYYCIIIGALSFVFFNIFAASFNLYAESRLIVLTDDNKLSLTINCVSKIRTILANMKTSLSNGSW